MSIQFFLNIKVMAILCAFLNILNKLWRKYVKKKERFVDKSLFKRWNPNIDLFFNRSFKHAREDIAC